jgi:AcrR family transcriptional regulator
MMEIQQEIGRKRPMAMQTAELVPLAEAEGEKKRQILAGASQVFLAKGFDAASMSEIARAAGVSKGTLYVYFKNKEELFNAIVTGACRIQAENAFEFDPNDHDVEATLTRIGTMFGTFMCRPDVVSSLRTVIAISARMPEQGRRFYETGPQRSVAQLRAYLEAQNAAGVLAVGDCEVAAAQFIDAAMSTTFKPVLFNFEAPTPERVQHVVKIAVDAFLAAYKVR